MENIDLIVKLQKEVDEKEKNVSVFGNNIETNLKKVTMKEEMSDITLLKSQIQTQILDLINSLTKKCLGLAQKKGWLDFADDNGTNKGILMELHENIDPSKKIVLKRIQNYFIENDDLELVKLAYTPYSALENIPSHMIKNKIIDYFERVAQIGNVIKVQEKGDGVGVQFGKIAHVQDKWGNIFQYYVKTHQFGLLSQTGRSAQPVDLIEPFAYKLLELCGMSPEVHFFYDDEKNFYIATKNEGFSLNGETEFITYEKIIANNKYKLAISKNQDLLDSAFLLIDLYCLVFNISDVLTNYGNFGFIKKNEDFVGFKIIDFRAPQTHLRPENVYAKWIEGGNHYKFSDTYVVSLLMKKNPKLIAKKMIPHFNECFAETTKNACNHLLKIAQQLYTDDKYEIFAKPLIEYAESVQYYYQELYKRIKDELTQLNS